MSTIEEVFAAKLVALGTSAGDRVFREIIEQEPKLPAIAFWRTGGAVLPRLLDTGRPALERANIRVEVIANTSADAAAVADAIRDAFDGWVGDLLGRQIRHCGCVFAGEASFAEGDLFLKIVQQDYEIIFA